MLIKSIEDRIKINKLITVTVIISCTVIVVVVSFFSYRTTMNANNNIYVLDNGIPIVANRTNVMDNREIEKKADIRYFHHLFFTMTPDDEYIKTQVEKALYLIDESGFNEHVNLKERGFYNSIISSNSVVTMKADSIVLNDQMNEFTYYGKQKIIRKTAIILRELITTGSLIDVPRSKMNSHGILIKNWRIVSNKTLEQNRNY
jgi:conjugative transposon TraK protein